MKCFCIRCYLVHTYKIFGKGFYCFRWSKIASYLHNYFRFVTEIRKTGRYHHEAQKNPSRCKLIVDPDTQFMHRVEGTFILGRCLLRPILFIMHYHLLFRLYLMRTFNLNYQHWHWYSPHEQLIWLYKLQLCLKAVTKSQAFECRLWSGITSDCANMAPPLKWRDPKWLLMSYWPTPYLYSTPRQSFEYLQIIFSESKKFFLSSPHINMYI